MNIDQENKYVSTKYTTSGCLLASMRMAILLKQSSCKMSYQKPRDE